MHRLVSFCLHDIKVAKTEKTAGMCSLALCTLFCSKTLWLRSSRMRRPRANQYNKRVSFNSLHCKNGMQSRSAGGMQHSPAHGSALRGNGLQLFGKEPQEPNDGAESTGFNMRRTVYFKNSRRFRCRYEQGSQSETEVWFQHVYFVALKHGVTVKLFSRVVKLTQMPPAWGDAPIQW